MARVQALTRAISVFAAAATTTALVACVDDQTLIRPGDPTVASPAGEIPTEFDDIYDRTIPAARVSTIDEFMSEIPRAAEELVPGGASKLTGVMFFEHPDAIIGHFRVTDGQTTTMAAYSEYPEPIWMITEDELGPATTFSLDSVTLDLEEATANAREEGLAQGFHPQSVQTHIQAPYETPVYEDDAPADLPVVTVNLVDAEQNGMQLFAVAYRADGMRAPAQFDPTDVAGTCARAETAVRQLGGEGDVMVHELTALRAGDAMFPGDGAPFPEGYAFQVTAGDKSWIIRQVPGQFPRAVGLDGGGWAESSYVPLAVVQAAARHAQDEVPTEGPAAWTIRSDNGAPAMEVFVGHEARPVPLPH